MIKDVFNDLTNSNLNDSRDTIMHHELIGTTKSRLFNHMVQRTLEIIQSQGNVFSLHSPPQLRNMLTQRHYEENLSQRIRNAMSDGQQRYAEFRNERFIKQTKKISDVIHKVKLPILNTDMTSKPDVKNKIPDGCTLTLF